jgi:hypothetical protein
VTVPIEALRIFGLRWRRCNDAFPRSEVEDQLAQVSTKAQGRRDRDRYVRDTVERALAYLERQAGIQR